MSLKDKLRSLIESTFTSKKAFIAEQALPASNYAGINVPLQNVDGWTYVPPADGYLKADVFSADQVFLHSGLLSYVDGGDRKGVFIPVRKGDGVSVGTANYQSGSNLTFFPLIGGGYLSSLVKSLCGGGLCLLSHLSKRFLNLSLIGQAQRNKLAIKCLRQQELIGTRRLFLRLTDLRQCISLAWFNPFTSQTSKLPEAFLRSLGIHSLAQFIRNTLLLLEKAKYFVSAFMRTKAGLQLSILPHGSARLSFCEGGAL